MYFCLLLIFPSEFAYFPSTSSVISPSAMPGFFAIIGLTIWTPLFCSQCTQCKCTLLILYVTLLHILFIQSLHNYHTHPFCLLLMVQHHSMTVAHYLYFLTLPSFFLHLLFGTQTGNRWAWLRPAQVSLICSTVG